MEKTIRFGLFLFLVTGLLFAGCQTPTEVDDDDVGGSLEESFEIETGTEEEDAPTESGYDAPLTNTGSTSTDCATVDPSLAAALGCAPTTETSESSYKDGTYSENAAYSSPAGQESLGVTLTIKDGVVSSVSISKNATNETSIQYQTLFADGISSLVVGKPIDSLGSIGAVNGSSLTPVGFNAAVEAVMADAQA